MADKIIWYSSSERPYKSGYVLIETIESTYYVDYIKSETFDEWSDEIIRWAYIDDNNYARYQNALSDVEYYKEENEKLKKLVDHWFDKYLDLLGKQHNEHQRDAFVGKRSKFAIDDYCGDIRDAYIRACIKETDREIERDLKPKIKREFLDDCCGGDNSDGDEHLTADDLCGVCKSDDAGSDGKISRDEIREIVLECMRKENERAADDGK